MTGRADPERVLRDVRLYIYPDVLITAESFYRMVLDLCAEFNRALNELTADPSDPQLLEAGAVRLMERYLAATAECEPAPHGVAAAPHDAPGQGDSGDE